MRQTPQAWTRRSTSPRPGLGIGTLLLPERTAGLFEHHRAHGSIIAPATLEAMGQRTDDLDLGRLQLVSGEGRRLDVEVAIEPIELGGEPYTVGPAQVPVRLDISRTTHNGWALRMRFEATLSGPCMRCLEPASPATSVDAIEVDQQGGGDELDSPYLGEGDVLRLADWARDALLLALPAQILCRPDCAGLCPICGEDLNTAGPEHAHDEGPDPRWAKLRELKLD